MIQSLFLLSPVGEVLIERHFRGVVTSRSVCDAFWDKASVSINHHGGVSASTSLLLNQQHYDSVPPVMEVPESDQGTLYLISILRDGLSYLGESLIMERRLRCFAFRILDRLAPLMFDCLLLK